MPDFDESTIVRLAPLTRENLEEAFARAAQSDGSLKGSNLANHWFIDHFAGTSYSVLEFVDELNAALSERRPAGSPIEFYNRVARDLITIALSIGQPPGISAVVLQFFSPTEMPEAS